MSQINLNISTNDKRYPVIIGKNLIKSFFTLLRRNSINFDKCLIVVDKKIKNKILKDLTSSLKKKDTNVFFFEANEKNKNQKSVDKILKILLKKNFNRSDCLISVGGGITGDVCGFSASIYKRGLRFINIPTTLLAQVDSSIGGKTGINSLYGKNLIGSFYQPNLVLSDTNLLKTLPKREIICGYGEILKHSLISNKRFFNFLDKNFLNILNLKSPFIEKAIYESCKIKRDIVQKDEKEKNLRMILNFGHTFAHAYEASMGYSKKLNHGEAVILGICSALKFSSKQKILNKIDFDLILNHINKKKLPRDLNNYFRKKDIKKIISFMKNDKKNNSNKINLILIKKIGSPEFKKQFSNKSIQLFLKKELIN